MTIKGVWSIPADVVTEVDENGQPTEEAPVATVTAYLDEESGTAFNTWEQAKQQTTPPVQQNAEEVADDGSNGPDDAAEQTEQPSE